MLLEISVAYATEQAYVCIAHIQKESIGDEPMCCFLLRLHRFVAILKTMYPFLNTSNLSKNNYIEKEMKTMPTMKATCKNSMRTKLNIYYSSLLCSFLLLAFEQFAYTCKLHILRRKTC